MAALGSVGFSAYLCVSLFESEYLRAYGLQATETMSG